MQLHITGLYARNIQEVYRFQKKQWPLHAIQTINQHTVKQIFVSFNIKNETKDYYIVDKTSDLLMNLKDVASV